MRKSVSQEIQLPRLKKNYSLQVCQQSLILKPKLHRIFYSPNITPKKFQTKITMLQSIITNKDYDDIKDQMKQNQIQRCLRDTQKNFLQKEQKLRGLVGKQAQIKYYDNYKKLDKILCKKKINKANSILPPIQQDPSTLVLQQVQNLGVLPCCMGFVKNKGQISTLSIKGQKFGDKYVKAISAGLKESKMIQNCQFSGNRLTNEGFNQIINNLGNQIIRLDFSTNKISKINPRLLSLINQPEARLEYLNLQNNLLTDKAINALCQSSSCSKHLKYLNIRKNLLTKNSSQAISQLILRAVNLQQLYIGVNRISDQGAIAIFDSLQENRTIKVFDYSLSNIGNNNPSCAKALANTIANNKVLIHTDFSGNNFNEQETKLIAQKLHGNKKIYGFHFGGNFSYIDSMGFMKLYKKQITSLHSIMQKNINSYDIIYRRQSNTLEPQTFKNVCWICQGWYEQIFKFLVPQPREDGKNFVYIHFDFEEYQPRLINISQTKVKYKTMVPPRKYKYFFTWNNQQFIDNYVQNNSTLKGQPSQKHVSGHQSCAVSQKTLQFPLTYTYQMNHQKVTFTVDKVSSRTGKPKKIVNNWDQLIVSVLPRQQGLVNKKQKKAWSYKDSLWSKQWKLDDQNLIRNCFQKDWKCSKIINLVKNQSQQQKIKELLSKNYRLIKQLYRYYASWSPFNGDIWAVSSTPFTQFCHLANIISKDTPLKITDLTFITTNSISAADLKGNSLVPERGLIRFQFMQCLVRLSEQKFKKNGLADSILGSITIMIKDHILPLEGNSICSSQKWRLQKYFCQQNDILLKKYRPIFTQLYKKNSKMKVKPGNKPFMCLAQFKSIIQRIGIAGSLVLQRDIFIAFNCSMMTQIDQLESQRFIRMTQIQFIQAIARCAFILPNTCRVQDIFESPTPFHAKFQWIIHQLKCLCSQDIKNMFSNATSLFNKSQDD